MTKLLTEHALSECDVVSLHRRKKHLNDFPNINLVPLSLNKNRGKMTDKNYSSWIQFRVCKTEKNLIKHRAETQNLSLSAFLRSRALSEEPKPESSLINQQWLIRALSSIGNQINHMQKSLENGEPISASTIKLTVRSFKKLLHKVQSYDC